MDKVTREKLYTLQTSHNQRRTGGPSVIKCTKKFRLEWDGETVHGSWIKYEMDINCSR
jgi:hypothetical protein